MGGPLLTGFLLDTHIWIWHLTGSERLPKGLRKAISESGTDLWLSPISVWETGWLVRGNRLHLRTGTFREWCDAATAALPVNEASLTAEVSIMAQELTLAHRDPADHLIAATAMVYGLTLLSVDRRLARIPGVKTRTR